MRDVHGPRAAEPSRARRGAEPRGCRGVGRPVRRRVGGGGPERPGHPFDGLGREPQVVLTRAGAAKVIWAEDLVSAFNRSFGEYVRSRGRSAGAGRWGPLETLVRVRRKRLQSPLLAL